VGGLFAGLTQLIQSIGPAIGGLVAGLLGTWAAITTVSTVLRQVQHLGGMEGGTTETEPETQGDTEEEDEDEEAEDVIEAGDDEDWRGLYPKNV
jgi:hypothetical protein